MFVILPLIQLAVALHSPLGRQKASVMFGTNPLHLNFTFAPILCLFPITIPFSGSLSGWHSYENCINFSVIVILSLVNKFIKIFLKKSNENNVRIQTVSNGTKIA